MSQLTRLFLLIYSYRRSLYGDCRASAKWQVRNIWFVASQTVFRLQKIWVKNLKHSSDYLACLTNMLQSENFTLYLIGTYWAQWLEHAKKKKIKIKMTLLKSGLSPLLRRYDWTNNMNVTLVWIHWWIWNDAQSLKQHRRGALLFLKVIRQISRSHGTKKMPILTRIERFRTVTSVWIHRWLWNDAQSLKQHRRGALLFFKVICQISRSHGIKNHWFWP